MVLRAILAFIVAVVVTDVALAAVNATFVIAELQALGIDVPPGARLSTMFGDALGIAPTFVPVLVIGYAIAFIVAWAVARWLLPGRQGIGYPLAGATCVLVVVVAVGQMYQTHPIPATRSLAGMLSVVACGALGGWLFHLLLGRGNDGALQRPAA